MSGSAYFLTVLFPDHPRHQHQNHSSADGCKYSAQESAEDSAVNTDPEDVEEPAANDGAEDSEHHVAEQPITRAIRDLAGDPAGNQAHNDPPQPKRKRNSDHLYLFNSSSNVRDAKNP